MNAYQSVYCKAYIVLALKRLKYNILEIEKVLIIMDSNFERYDKSQALSKARKVLNGKWL